MNLILSSNRPRSFAADVGFVRSSPRPHGPVIGMANLSVSMPGVLGIANPQVSMRSVSVSRLQLVQRRKSLLVSTRKRIKSLGYGYIIKKINNVRVIQDVN